MRETGQDLGGLSYPHLQHARLLDDEAWIDHLVRVGSLRYRALKNAKDVEDCLNNSAAPPLNNRVVGCVVKNTTITFDRPIQYRYRLHDL